MSKLGCFPLSFHQCCRALGVRNPFTRDTNSVLLSAVRSTCAVYGAETRESAFPLRVLKLQAQ